MNAVTMIERCALRQMTVPISQPHELHDWVALVSRPVEAGDTPHIAPEEMGNGETGL